MVMLIVFGGMEILQAASAETNDIPPPQKKIGSHFINVISMYLNDFVFTVANVLHIEHFRLGK